MVKRYFCSIFVTVIMIMSIIAVFTGCEEDDGSGHTFKYNLSSNPQNLDPQLASDEASIFVIRNTMSGLVKKEADGSIQPDVAKSYTISDDGLVYTFELKDDIFWESVDYTEKLTADDFVFAFQRIYDSSALFSPYIDDFRCIKNADGVSKGILSKDELGVKATSDHTLQIELEYPCFDFIEKLTLTGAMPCNKAFFEYTKGRYGLAAETTVSNGAFYLKEWNYDQYWDNNYMILRRNKSNSQNYTTYPYSLNFFIKNGTDTNMSDLKSGSIDCTVVSNYDKKEFSNNQYESYATKTYGLIFNTDSKYLSSKNIREALASAFVRIKSENQDYISGCGIIPPGISIAGRKYRELVSDESLNQYDKDKAFTLWNNELKANNYVSIDGLKITVPESFGDSELLSGITEQWQQNLGFFCGVEVVSENEYQLKLSDKTYDIALVEISSSNGTASGFFDRFVSDNDLFTPNTGYAAAGAVSQILRAENLGKATELYTKAEQIIINSYEFVPICYGNEYLLYPTNVSDLNYDPITHSIDFRNAKYFE
ncbi:MAG: peptide ABC transporter substrate-binding protein [Oscillospiraceae bacterium]